MFAASSVARTGTGCQAITRMRAHKMVRAPRQSATLLMGTPDLGWTAPLRKHVRMGDKRARQTLAPQKPAIAPEWRSCSILVGKGSDRPRYAGTRPSYRFYVVCQDRNGKIVTRREASRGQAPTRLRGVPCSAGRPADRARLGRTVRRPSRGALSAR